MPKDHSYEEICAVTIDILAGRERMDTNEQFNHLMEAVATVFETREGSDRSPHSILGNRPALSYQDAELFREVFWDLFLQRIITLGSDNANREFPWYRLTQFGRKVLDNQQPYFFHNVSTYETLVKSQVPEIDETTLMYLKESMQAFRSGCILSASVMLGIATEHTFLLLLETIEANEKHKATYASVQKERSILPKINKFRGILDKHVTSLPAEVKEDLDTQFAAIQSVIRIFRNESGHPTGKIIDREQAYVLLQLFIPYAKKMYQLIDYFTAS